MSSLVWSQNMLYLHLSQKTHYMEIKSFSGLVLFLELICYFEIKFGGSNLYNYCFGHNQAIQKEHRHFILESVEDIVQCTQQKTSSRRQKGPFIELDSIFWNLQNQNFEKDLNVLLYSSITIELCGKDDPIIISKLQIENIYLPTKGIYVYNNSSICYLLTTWSLS